MTTVTSALFTSPLPLFSVASSPTLVRTSTNVSRLEKYRQRDPRRAGVGIAYMAPWSMEVDFLWFDHLQQLQTVLLNEILPLVAEVSWATPHIARKIRSLAMSHDGRASISPKLVDALRNALDPWVQLSWVGTFDGLRRSESHFAEEMVRKFLDLPDFLLEDGVPPLPSYQVPRFIAMLQKQPLPPLPGVPDLRP